MKKMFLIMAVVVGALFGLVDLLAAVTINPGDIIVAVGTGSIVKVDPVTGAQTLISTGGVFPGQTCVQTPYPHCVVNSTDPLAIAIASNGDIITTGSQSGVTRVNPSTGAQTTISSGGLLGLPAGIAIAANGDLFIANFSSAVIRVDPSSGTQTLVAQGGFLSAPLGIAIAANGDLFVTNYDGGIVRVNPTTGAQTPISSKMPHLMGIAIDANGDLIVGVGSAVYQVNPTTGTATLITPNGVRSDTWGLAIEANGNIILTATFGVLVRVDRATGAATELSPPPDSTSFFGMPRGVAIAGATGGFTSGGGGNQFPVANAGPDQTVHVGAAVILDGTGSFDPDGNIPLTYAWTIAIRPAGSTATLSSPTAILTSFTPDVVGDYTIQLIVTDSLGASSPPALVKISTTNSAPVADAGPDQALIQLGTTVQLDGSKSYDPDGDPITFAWSLIQKPAGSTAALSNATAAKPTFVADVHGDYVARLVVTDSFGAPSVADTVVISFTNVKPVANAGPNQAVTVGQIVLLDGSGSSDANGDLLTYSWNFASKPAASTATLVNPMSITPSFVADVAGIYVVSLVVNDGFVNSDQSNVTVMATSKQDQAIQTLKDVIAVINNLSPTVFKNPNMQNALTNKINAVLQDIDQGLYQQALDKLQNDILAKTDGCAQTEAPDKNDWIKDCASQNQVYPLIIQAINLLKSLL